jgi:hypothetical protein
VIAYRELRLLELDVLRALDKGEASLDVAQFNILCDVDQFFGIEIEEFPAQIAQTALWLMDHQMNLRVSEEFGKYFVRLPLRKSATIVHGNALRMDWREIVKPEALSYILGNPPFGGKKEQSKSQKEDMAVVFADVPSAGLLDFVTAWYRKAADYMADNPKIKAAFVSTNSITQGEQVGVLWPDLMRRGVKIHFAHRTFQWSSEARGKAAVHCVIIGFALHDTEDKRIFDYETPQAEPHEVKAKNINSYLVDAPSYFLERREKPICDVPEINKGSEATDFGFLVLSPAERADLIKSEPLSEKWIRPFIGGDEYINNVERYCLWLKGVEPNEIKSMPKVMERVKKVQAARAASKKERTIEWAKFPALFTENRQPQTSYLVVPKVSSERRSFIPIGFVSEDWIASGSVQVIPSATLYHFGILSSSMHMAWMRTTAGRMKSDYQYSNTIVYNNFPWPQTQTDKQKQAIENAAQAVLDARAQFPNASLADLYDPLTMPPALTKAHHKLDAAVDMTYAKRKFTGDSDRVAFLFELYQHITSPLESKQAIRRKRAKTG